MKPRVALIIGAVTALFFGLMLIAAPSKMLEGLGLDAHGDGILLSRDVGALGSTRCDSASRADSVAD